MEAGVAVEVVVEVDVVLVVGQAGGVDHQALPTIEGSGRLDAVGRSGLFGFGSELVLEEVLLLELAQAGVALGSSEDAEDVVEVEPDIADQFQVGLVNWVGWHHDGSASARIASPSVVDSAVSAAIT